MSEDPTAWVVRHYGPDWGPRTKYEAVLARGEVDERGYLTGGPHTEAEWRDWREKFDRGQIGRYSVRE